MSSKSVAISFNGGIDVVSPAIEKKPGELLTGINIEPYIDGGYVRAKGYIAFDGRPSPDNTTLNTIQYNTGSGAQPHFNDTFNGNVIVAVTITSGSWAGGNAVGIFYTEGVFDGIEYGSIDINGAGNAVLDGSLIEYSEYGFLTEEGKEVYADTFNHQLSLITEVPGAGPVLGVHIYQSNIYAFRDNIGHTEAFMYKSTVNGWLKIVTPTLFPGGKYDFVNYTMSNDVATGGEKMYGANGVDKAFQYHTDDGFVQLECNVPTIVGFYPSFIVGQRDHIMAGYAIGQISVSAVGNPLEFNSLNGGSRFIVSDEITGFNHVVGDDLVVYCRNSIKIMYGRNNKVGDPDAFRLETHSVNTGAFRWTGQSSQFSLFMSEQGISSLNAVLEYGNFEILSLSLKVRPMLAVYENDNLIAGSVFDNDHGVYRLYMRDGKSFVMSYDGKTAGSIITNEYDKRFFCIAQGKFYFDKVFFAGGEDGFVYQLEKSNSLNGSVIPMSLQTVYDHFLGEDPGKSVDSYKTFNKIRILIDSPDELVIQLNVETAFGNSPPNLISNNEEKISSGGGLWDVSKWNEFVWSGSQVAEDERYIDAIGHNLSTYMYSETKFTRPYVIQGIVYQFMQRGQIR